MFGYLLTRSTGITQEKSNTVRSRTYLVSSSWYRLARETHCVPNKPSGRSLYLPWARYTESEGTASVLPTHKATVARLQRFSGCSSSLDFRFNLNSFLATSSGVLGSLQGNGNGTPNYPAGTVQGSKAQDCHVSRPQPPACRRQIRRDPKDQTQPAHVSNVVEPWRHPCLAGRARTTVIQVRKMLWLSRSWTPHGTRP